jgi:hypothetical protein
VFEKERKQKGRNRNVGEDRTKKELNIGICLQRKCNRKERKRG